MDSSEEGKLFSLNTLPLQTISQNLRVVSAQTAHEDRQNWRASCETSLIDLSAPKLSTNASSDLTQNIQVLHNGGEVEINDTGPLDSIVAQSDFEADPRLNALVKLLGFESEAKVVLKVYIDDGFMPERGRNIIVQSFIRKKETALMQSYKGQPLEDWIIDKDEFIKFSSEIEKLFPTENSETYYNQFHIENEVRFPATGKLINRFDYRKGQLRAAGILKPSVKKPKAKEPVRVNTAFTDTTAEKVKYLETHSDDPERVKIYWSETREFRDVFLKVERKSVYEYLKKFKALREQLGRELIELDFDLSHPGKTNALSEKWPKINTHVIRLLSRAKLSAEENTFFKLLPSLQPDNQAAVLFYLLPKIIPCGKTKVVKKRKYLEVEVEVERNENLDPEEEQSAEEELDLIRILKSDSYRSSYMLQIPSANEENAALEKLKQTLYEQNLTLQPIIVIVGSVVNIRQTYVVVCDIWYATDSFLAGVNLAFQAFFVLDCEYPAKAKNLWQFVQLAAFDIKLPSEKIGLKVRAIAKELSSSVP